MFPIRDTNRSTHTAVITFLIILINVVVFAMEKALPEARVASLFSLYGVVPARYTHPGWAAMVGLPAGGPLPFITSLFLHAGWFHIIANMWVLWIFGDNVEDRMGAGRFMIFYLLCGLVAGMAHLFSQPASQLPTVGASGAIAGVMGAYLVLFPRARVLTVIPIFFYPLFLEVPAVVFMAVWFMSQLVSGLSGLGESQATGGVAWWAHVGGFLAGLILVGLFARRRPPAAGQLT